MGPKNSLSGHANRAAKSPLSAYMSNPFVFNAHVHPRELESTEFDESMPIYVRDYGAVYMLNFKERLDISDPLAAAGFLYKYVDAIKAAARNSGNPDHIPLLMPVLHDQMTPESLDKFIIEAQRTHLPLAGFKLFPRGQSTNSGYAPPMELAVKLIDVIEAHGLPLALHMEDPNEPDASKKEESAIRNILPMIIYRNGKRREMPISVEHVSTEYAAEEVMRLDLWMSMTPQHLIMCQEAFGITDPSDAESILQAKYPYFYCKPVLQTAENQGFLRDVWLDGKYDKLIPGTDSAPHVMEKKETNPPAAGIMMGDTEEAYKLVWPEVFDLIERYSLNACGLYGLKPDKSAVERYCYNRMPLNENSLFRVKNVREMWVKMQRQGVR